MLTNVYVVRDRKAKEAPLILTAPNDDLLKRQVTSALLDRNYNFINLDRKDKSIYKVGTYETTDMVFVSQPPELVFEVQDVFLDLVAEIKEHNAITEGISKPVEVPDAEERRLKEMEALAAKFPRDNLVCDLKHEGGK